MHDVFWKEQALRALKDLRDSSTVSIKYAILQAAAAIVYAILYSVQED